MTKALIQKKIPTDTINEQNQKEEIEKLKIFFNLILKDKDKHLKLVQLIESKIKK